jgi:hypothetical protein
VLKASVFLILAFVFAGLPAMAEPYRRAVEFEWEVIEGAKSYDVELKLKTKVLQFHSKEAQWSGRLAPGVYQMRIRAKDRRGVPANWSSPEDFRVNLETPQLLSPKSKEALQTQESKESEVEFRWQPVGGAQKYIFELRNSTGEILKTEPTEETHLKFSLPVAQSFEWKVRAIGKETESEQTAADQFSVIGKKIAKPQIERPENDFVRELHWSAPDFTTGYDYSLQRYDLKNKKWEKVSDSQDIKEPALAFDPQWPGGKYKLSLKASSPLRTVSDPAEIQFQVRNGDRSPAAEETFTIRQSIDRLSGWYAIASYLITMVDYHGTNYDRGNSTLNYSAIGGTGRLGAGFLSPKTSWGFLGIADFSGMTVDGSGNFTYASMEGNAVYRTHLNDRDELRQSFGLFYKELPETIGRASSAITETNMLKAVGPHYGLEYWYALSPKLGFQVNTHLYPSLLKIKTTNDQALSPTLSYQFGLLGSYRFKRTITGLLGYAYRNDQIDYKAQAGKGSAGTADNNTVQLSGHYLNLFLEWAL